MANGFHPGKGSESSRTLLESFGNENLQRVSREPHPVFSVGSLVTLRKPSENPGTIWAGLWHAHEGQVYQVKDIRQCGHHRLGTCHQLLRLRAANGRTLRYARVEGHEEWHSGSWFQSVDQ